MAHAQSTHTQRPGERTDKASLVNRIPIDLTETARKQFGNLADVQTELFERFQKTSKWWLDRMRMETDFAAEFASKLSAAWSIPDAMSLYQQWSERRLEMMAEDARHFLNDTQKFMRVGAHMAANGRKGLGVST